MKKLFIALIVFPLFLFAKEAPKVKKPEQRKPNQEYKIQPLDADTEKVLKASEYANQIREFDDERKDFQTQAGEIAKKLQASRLIPNLDHLAFIYDVLFMVESGFNLKYQNIPKQKLASARKIVIDAFKDE